MRTTLVVERSLKPVVWSLVGVLATVVLSIASCSRTNICDVTTCGHGCCDDADLCQTVGTPLACGDRAEACQRCAADQLCLRGACISGIGGGTGAMPGAEDGRPLTTGGGGDTGGTGP